MNDIAKEYKKGISSIVAGIVSVAGVAQLELPWLENPTNAAAVTGLLTALFVIFGPANIPRKR